MTEDRLGWIERDAQSNPVVQNWYVLELIVALREARSFARGVYRWGPAEQIAEWERLMPWLKEEQISFRGVPLVPGGPEFLSQQQVEEYGLWETPPRSEEGEDG